MELCGFESTTSRAMQRIPVSKKENEKEGGGKGKEERERGRGGGREGGKNCSVTKLLAHRCSWPLQDIFSSTRGPHPNISTP